MDEDYVNLMYRADYQRMPPIAQGDGSVWLKNFRSAEINQLALCRLQSHFLRTLIVQTRVLII